MIELDKHFWSSDLHPMSGEEWARLTSDLAARPTWVMDGDLGPYDVLAPRLRRADTVLILDYGVFRCVWRAHRRSRERADFWWWVLTWRRRSRPVLLRAIAEREGIAVGDDDVDAAVERISLAAQTSEQPQQAEAFARSDYVRGMLQSELFERQLTDRLLEIATEGRGAVVNAWTAPVTESSDSATADDETVAGGEEGSEAEADGKADEGETSREDA